MATIKTHSSIQVGIIKPVAFQDRSETQSFHEISATGHIKLDERTPYLSASRFIEKFIACEARSVLASFYTSVGLLFFKIYAIYNIYCERWII